MPCCILGSRDEGKTLQQDMRCYKETTNEWLIELCRVEQGIGKNRKTRHDLPQTDKIRVAYYVLSSSDMRTTCVTTEMESYREKLTERKSDRKQKGKS